MPAPRQLLAAAAAALVMVTAPNGATAASIRLHVQAPFDLAAKKFDLQALETQNTAPVFGRTFEVPYSSLEPLIAGALEDVVGRDLHIQIQCWGLGVAELCPDTTVGIKLHSSFKFTQKGQPTVTRLGPAKDDSLRVTLDVQARVALDAAIHHETGIWNSGSETVDLFVLIGAHAQVDLKLWPTPTATNLEVKLTRDGGNIAIDGLSEQILLGGTVLGGALLGPTGALFGAILGSIGAKAAQDAIKGAIEDAISEQLNAANVQLRDLIKAQIDPAIAQAVDYQDKALATKLPGIGLTVAQALAVGPASLDVRTRVVGGEINTVVTTRFDPTPHGKSLQGKIRFPKTRCKYSEGGTKLTVEPANADLAGKSCAALISASSFARSTYLGESPEKLLKSGDLADALPSWQSTGTVSTSGTATDKGSYYECPYTLSNLPAAAILDLGAVKGSELSERLDTLTFRARFLLAAAVGPALLFGARGQAQAPTALIFGGEGPGTLDDCPSYSSSGTGPRPDRVTDLNFKNFKKDKFDPEECPTCGLLDVFNHDDLLNPGAHAKIELTSVPDKLAIAARVDQSRAEFASRGAIEGLQRIQSTLDGGLLSRSWAAVDKARTRPGKSRIHGVKVTPVGRALGRKRNIKVFDAGQAVPLRAARLPDAALPKTNIEVRVKGNQRRK